MEIIAIIGVGIISVGLAIFEWPRFNQDEKREKLAFVSILVFAFVLSSVFIVYPEMKGPTELTFKIFSPFFPLLE